MTTRTASVAKKREDRRENDQYESPEQLCTEVCKLLGGMKPQRILEPGAGGGNFVVAAHTQWPAAHITAIEIMPKLVSVSDREAHALARKQWKKDLDYWKWERENKGVTRSAPREPPAPEPVDDALLRLQAAGAHRVAIRDFLEPVNEPAPFDLILGNPPYSLVEAFIERSIEVLAPGGVLAFVLKMHVFGTKKRTEMWKKLPYYVAFPINPRPDFTGEGRDTSEYTLVTWKKMKDGTLMRNQQLLADQPLEWAQ